MKSQLFAALASALALVLSSCGKNEPGKDVAVKALEAQLPVGFKVLSAETEYSPDNETTGTLRIKAVVAPLRDTYEQADNMVAVWKRENPNRLDRLGRSDRVLKDAVSEGIPIPQAEVDADEKAMIALNAAIRQANRRAIYVSSKAGTTKELLGRAKANFEFKQWKIGGFELDTRLRTGTDRGEFPDDAVLDGSEEFQKIVRTLGEACAAREAAHERLLAALAQATKDAAEAALRKEAQETIAARAPYKPGTKYSLPYNLGDKQITAILEILDYDTVREQFSAAIYDQAAPAFRKLYNGTLSRDRRTEKLDGNPTELRGEKDGPVRIGIDSPVLFEATTNKILLVSKEPGRLHGENHNMLKGDHSFDFVRIDDQITPQSAATTTTPDPVGEWTTRNSDPEFRLCCWESGDARAEVETADESIYLKGHWKTIEDGKWKGYMHYSGIVEYWSWKSQDITPKDGKFEGIFEVESGKLTHIKGLDATAKNGRKFFAAGADGNNMVYLHKQNSNRPKIPEPGN